MSDHGSAAARSQAGGPNRFFFLARCAEFYQEIVNLKNAMAEGKLSAYLCGSDDAPLLAPSDLAARTSVRLLAVLRRQNGDFLPGAAAEEIRVHKMVLYAMAALADEIFILELDWPGRDAWLDVLLEQRMFSSSNAGTRFFVLAQQLLKMNRANTLYVDLAAVFLLAMELGFKGCHRGRQGAAALNAIRQQLYRMVNEASGITAPGTDALGLNKFQPRSGAGHPPAFGQAYQYVLLGGKDERLAPFSPWRNLAGYALLAYVVLTMVVWLVLMLPFERYINS